MLSFTIDMSHEWLAIGVSLFAGLATALGGCIVYFKSFVKLANRSFLSVALGFSSGVMLLLSFYEMFSESQTLFMEYFSSERKGTVFAGLSLLGGVLLSFLMEFLLHKGTNVEFELADTNEQNIQNDVHGKSVPVLKRASTKESEPFEITEGHIISNPIVHDNKDIEMQVISSEVVLTSHTGYEIQTVSGSTRDLAKAEYFMEDDPQKNLQNMGLLSMLAITAHNFPEGIISYIAYLASPSMGIALAIGIAAHNIPEGLSIALPIYYATNSRNKAFLWSLLAGLAEPAGAMICSLVLHGKVNIPLFGFLYGCVAGIMIYICIYELIPTGVTLDCEKNYTCGSFLFGVFFIIATLCLVLCVCCKQRAYSNSFLYRYNNSLFIRPSAKEETSKYSGATSMSQLPSTCVTVRK